MRRFAGLGLAVVSAASFATSGSLAAALQGAGWSAGAAVTARVGIAAAALTVPAAVQLRGRWAALRRGVPATAAYGLFAVAGAQLCYFNAVRHLSVAIALLLEYSGVLLVVGWMWASKGHRPHRATVAGTGLAAAGLAMVLDLFGSQHVETVGVLWGLGAAVGLAVYFVVSADTESTLPPLAISWLGLCVGAGGLLLAAGLGVLPMRAPHRQVVLHSTPLPWWAAVLSLALVAAALAYVTGVSGARRLGARLASFVGLTEVLFASGFAWLLLGQRLDAVQALGGALVVAGIALVRLDDAERAAPGAPAAGPAGGQELCRAR